MLSNFFNVSFAETIAIFFGITIVFFIWLIWLTILVLRSQKIFQAFFSGNDKKNIQDVINKILAQSKNSQDAIELLKNQLGKIELNGKKHIQKIGLFRFNPFKDTGGDQSFILSLLDENSDGLVISSLFSRTGNRWYVKKVKTGKGVDVELSEEENKTIQIAQ